MTYYIAPGSGGSGTPGGTDTQVQFNDGGAFGGDSGLLFDKTTNKLTAAGDIELNDGGSFTTTIQTVTPTANRTLSFPDATGTLALVGGSSTQVLYNASGALAGISTLTFDGTTLTTAGRFVNSYTSLASSPAKAFTGSWFTGGSATTTKPHLLIEPAGTTSTAWSTSGTGLGVNAASGFAGKLIDVQLNGSSQFAVDASSGTGVTCVRLQASNRIDATNLLMVGAQTILGSGTLGLGTGGTADAIFYRDAAGIFAQRNSTNAQAFRCYNTYTSATSFERAKIEWSSNVLRIGTEKGADGGTARDMELQTDGTTRVTVKASGAIILSGLPTSDPAVAGQLWNDGNTLKVSAG